MKKTLSTFVYAILAGFCIGIGGNVYLALLPTSKALGALLFTVGLFTICSLGFALYTGKACYIFDNPPSYAASLITIWLGNLVGTWLMGTLVRMTRLGPAFSEAAAALCQTKLDDGYLSLFLLGVVCNVLIYIAVEGYKVIPHEVGKYAALIFGVMVFILTGTEHSIADMYYFATAGMLFSGKTFVCLLVISLGNLVGAVLLPLGRKLAAYLAK